MALPMKEPLEDHGPPRALPHIQLTSYTFSEGPMEDHDYRCIVLVCEGTLYLVSFCHDARRWTVGVIERAMGANAKTLDEEIVRAMADRNAGQSPTTLVIELGEVGERMITSLFVCIDTVCILQTRFHNVFFRPRQILGLV